MINRLCLNESTPDMADHWSRRVALGRGVRASQLGIPEKQSRQAHLVSRDGRTVVDCARTPHHASSEGCQPEKM
jgi:hypothetical protein